MAKRAVVSWSGGKDSSYALYKALQDDDIEVVSLLTTVSAAHDRVSIHGVPTAVVERQAEQLGLPLTTLSIPANCGESQYKRLMIDALQDQRQQGVDTVVAADIFLSSAREQRESQLSAASLEGYWPLWGEDTTTLLNRMIAAGFRAVTCCVDTAQLDASFVGRDIDERFAASLPDGVDPCGEYGEFHTLVWDGPIFDQPLPIKTGRVVERNVASGTHYYADIQLGETP